MPDILTYLHKPFPSYVDLNVNIKDIKRYLDKGGDIHHRNEDGLFDALMWNAVDHEDLKQIKFLLENGGDEFINKKVEPGYTSEGVWFLYAAVENNNYKMIELFLDYGADPNIDDCYILQVVPLKIYSVGKPPRDNRKMAKHILKLLLRNGLKITEKTFPTYDDELIKFLNDMRIKKTGTDILDTLLYT